MLIRFAIGLVSGYSKKRHVFGDAVSRGYDTCFEKGFVMDYADCTCSLGLVETSFHSFNRNLGPLSDTLQAGV